MSISQIKADPRECANPECPTHDSESTVYGALVEPEVDGDHRFYECEECDFAFGYEKIQPPATAEPTCAAGVPESVRRQASAPMEKALADDQKRQPIPVTIRRRGE